MKLFDCITMGRFMGLHTVEECMSNYYLHYLHILPHDQATPCQEELELEFSQYEKGELELDWDKINKEVERQNKEMEEYFEKQYDELKYDQFEGFK